MLGIRSGRSTRPSCILGLGAALLLAGSALTVAPPPVRADSTDYLTLAAYPNPAPVAGVPYGIELYASKSNGDPDECFSDHVILIYSDTSTAGPSGYVFSDGTLCTPLGAWGGDLGEYWFEITPYTSGPQTITAYDVSDTSVTTATFNYTVAPGPAASLTLSSLPATVVQDAGTTMTVTAYDAEGNLATGYDGTVLFTSSDSGASGNRTPLPAVHVFDAGDAGTWRFVLRFETTGNQWVTATDGSDSAITATASTKVKPDDHFDIQVGDEKAGAYTSCTVTAKTETGSADTGYTGTVLFTTSDPNPNVILPSNGSTPDQVKFTSGMGGVFECYEFDLMFYTAGVQSLTATDTTSGFTGSGSAVITGGDTATISLGGLPSTVFAGPIQVTVRAFDAYGNWGSDGGLSFTSSDPLAVLPQDFSFHTSDYGTRQFTVTFKTPGLQWLKVSGSEGKTTLQGTISTNVVAGVATHLLVSGVENPYPAGTWGSVTVTAADAFGNPDPRYHGTVHFASSDAAATLRPDYTFLPTDAGTATFSTYFVGSGKILIPHPAIVLQTAGTQSVTVTDAADSLTGTQSGILVTPGAATSLSVSGLTSPRAAGAAGTVTVIALDDYGNTATGYTGTVHISSSDGAAVLPADHTFTGADAGIHSFTVTLETYGTQSVTATDAANSLAGSESGIAVGYHTTTYHASTTPARVLDSRPTGSGHTNIGLAGKFTAGTVRTFQVTGVIGVGASKIAVPTNATAVTGNLTVVGETAAGVVALGPTMTPTGATTTINFLVGDTRANNVTLGLGPNGALSAVYRSSTAGATLDLIFDVTGYFTPDATGATYHTLAPGRVLDTRATGSGHTNIGLAGKFTTKTPRYFNVAGVKGLGWSSALVPSNATAVTGNLTVTNATSVGYVSVGPTIAAVPSTSTINVAAGSNIANGVTVALNAGRLEAVWDGVAGSSADVLFDVTGYFTADGTGLSYCPVVPVSDLDTTINLGLTGAFASGTSRTLAVGVGQVPVDAAGISGNLTVVNPSSNGYAFISPTKIIKPTSSTINITASHAGANGFDVALSLGSLAIIWVGGVGSTADVALDITGYWK